MRTSMALTCRAAAARPGFTFLSALVITCVAWSAEPTDEQQVIADAVAQINAGQAGEALQTLHPLTSSRDLYVRAAAKYYAGHAFFRLKNNDFAIKTWLSITAPRNRQSAGAHWYYQARIELAKLILEGKALDLPPESRAPAAIKMLEEILSAPAFAAIQAQAALDLGALSKKAGHLQAAQKYYQQGLKLLESLDNKDQQPLNVQNQADITKELQARIVALEQAFKTAEAAAKEATAEVVLPEDVQSAKAALVVVKETAKQGSLNLAIQQLKQLLASAPARAQADEARYLLGRYFLDVGLKQQAFTEWERLLALDPLGPHRGQALLDALDHELFREFSTKRASAWAVRLEKTLALATTQPADPDKKAVKKNVASKTKAAKEAAAPASAATTDLLAKEAFDALPVVWQHAYRALVHRRGLIEWAEGKSSISADLLESSRKFNPQDKTDELADSNAFTGVAVEPCIEALRSLDLTDARQKLPITADKPEVAAALRFGELAYGIKKFKEARNFFDAVAMEKSPLLPTPEQEGYALLRAGLCAHWMNDREAVLAYSRAITQRKRLVNTVAVARAYKREAVLAYSVDKNPEKALFLMREVYTRFPKTDEAIDAIFFTGVILEWEGQRQKAINAYLAALEAYPDHPGMRTAVKNRFLELKVPLPEELKEEQGEKK